MAVAIRRRLHWSLRQKLLVLFVVVSLLPLVSAVAVVVTGGTEEVISELLELQERRAVQASRAVALTVERALAVLGSIAAEKDLLDAAAAAPSSRSARAEATQRLDAAVRRLRSDVTLEFAALRICDGAGRVVAETVPAGAEPAAGGEGWLGSARRGPAVGEVLWCSGHRCVRLAVPMRLPGGAGVLEGLLVTDEVLGHIADVLGSKHSSLVLGPAGEVVMGPCSRERVGSGGAPAASGLGPQALRRARAVFERASSLGGAWGSFLGRDLQGREALVGYARVELPGAVTAARSAEGGPGWWLLSFLPRKRVWAPFRRRLWVPAVAAGVTVLVLAVVGWVVSRSAVRPLEAMTAQARHIAEGHFEERVTPAGSIEFRQLAGAINAMAERLAEVDSLRTEELMERQALLERANRDLQEMNRYKNEFLANVSHELRTPLNTVIGFTELALEGGRAGALSERQRKHLQRVLRAGRQLRDLLGEVLDLSAIEAGRVEVRAETFRLATLLRRVVAEFRSRAAEKGLETALHLSDPGLTVTTDRQKLRQILSNLLSNAVKFTDSGRVEVSAQPLGSMVQISVADTGPGIPPEAKEVIFEPFRQLDGSTTRLHEGAGLGLAICQKLTRLLGGRITVQSTLGEGSTFRLLLPRLLRGTEGEREAEELGRLLTQVPARPRPHTPLVLCVSGDVEVLEELRRLVQDGGYQFLGARTVAEALNRARQLRPACIVTDMVLADADGWEFLELLRADASTAGIPVAVRGYLGDVERGTRLGVGAVLAEPMTEEALRAVLDRLTGVAQHWVWMVDDDPAARALVREFCRGSGFAFRAFASVGEVRRELERARPQVLLVDLLLPGESGWALLEELTASGDTLQFEVAVITARELTPEQERWLARRAVPVIIKSGLTREGFLASLMGLVDWHQVPRAAAAGGSAPPGPSEAHDDV